MGQEKIADVIDLQSLARRGMAAAPRDDNGFSARQAEHYRATHLQRAQPRLRAADLDKIRFGTLGPTRHLSAVQWWLESDRNPILCLAGTVGSGKSMAASWALAEVGGAYIHAHDLVRLWHSYGQQAQTAIADLAAARLLVIDDLGVEQDGARMGVALLDMVDRRQGVRRTILTTNLNRKRLRERYPDPRLWSRLDRDMTYAGVAGDDLRGTCD